MGRTFVHFAYAARAAAPAAKRQMAEFMAILARLSGLEFRVTNADGYEKLARMVAEQTVDVAWLPPIPFLALEKREAVRPLVSNERGGATEFECVLIVPAASPIHAPATLAGKRAAWVDPLSAAGYVVPRIQLAALGVDPRTAFSREHFYGSHEAVVRAVVGGKADFGATYARASRGGRPRHGPWNDLAGAAEAVRVLCSFGVIPGDVIAARHDLSGSARYLVKEALLEASQVPEGKRLMGEIFGVDQFKPWAPGSYDLLRNAVSGAMASGLLQGAQK